MAEMAAPTLLNPRDPNPVRNTPFDTGNSAFVLVGDHAGCAIPAALGDLGLSAADRARHIAVDLGTRTLGDTLAKRLGAPFVSQVYSRLAIDCNRDPARNDSIVEASDGTLVPGNVGLSGEARQMRRTEIFDPYHSTIAQLLDERPRAIVISLHSFTPVMGSTPRPWDVGILHNGHRDDFAWAMLAELRRAGEIAIGDNAPYRMDETDYTLPRHAFARQLQYVELEVRQDHLSNETGVAAMAGILFRTLENARGRITPSSHTNTTAWRT